MTPRTLRPEPGPEPTVELFGDVYGHPVKLGMELGLAIEPSVRWGRLVAVRRDSCREIERYVVREYEPDDVDGIPTGEYRTTARVWLRPRR